MDSLDDESLSGWSCSVHEAFSSYPSVGKNGFQALAIAQDILGVGSQTFGDDTVGLPYIISRGATPAKCGDGVWDEEFGEECDDGNTLNGDGCSLSCKCESGKPKGDGTCLSSNSTTPGGPTGTGSSHIPSTYPTGPSVPSGSYIPDGPYGNASATPTYTYYPPGSHPTSVYSPPPYVTPSCPTGPKIIGVEYIVEVTYSATEYVPCSTSVRPIYDTSTSILPCYICAMSTEDITYTSTDFVTVSTTTCKESEPTPTYFPPVVKPCKKCEEHTFTETECIGGPHTEYTPIPYVPPTPHVHTTIGGVETHVYEYTTAAPVCTDCPGYSFVTYPVATPTGTSKYYPTSTYGVAEYTGAAVNKEVKAAGVVGGALVALMGLL